jgi:hypothetical protein
MTHFYWSRLAVVLAMVFQLQGCATSYSARAMTATVRDADSGAPLQGVIVVAHWVLSFGLEGGGTDLVLMETVTDENGRFGFPAWGPVAVPSDLPIEARLKAQDPELLFFTEGYAAKSVANERPISAQYASGPAIRSSDWDGKAIMLRRFAGSRMAYGSMLNSVLTGITYRDCAFRKIPRLLAVMMKTERELRAQHVPNALVTLELLQDVYDGRCGSVEEFFKAHQQ